MQFLDAGLEAFSFDGGVPRVCLEQVECDAPDQCEVAGGVVLTQAAAVFVGLLVDPDGADGGDGL